jgi:hypothetical protein
MKSDETQNLIRNCINAFYNPPSTSLTFANNSTHSGIRDQVDHPLAITYRHPR